MSEGFQDYSRAPRLLLNLSMLNSSYSSEHEIYVILLAYMMCPINGSFSIQIHANSSNFMGHLGNLMGQRILYMHLLAKQMIFE